MRPILLHINRLGLIRDADLELSPLMVFSGESGLGKSYVAILCHYFFHVLLNEKRLSSFIKNQYASQCVDFFNPSQEIQDRGEALSFSKKDLENWLAMDAIQYLSYMLGCEEMKADISVILPDVIGPIITFTYERELMGIDNNEDLYWKLSVMHLTYRFRQLGIQDESPYSYVLRFALIAELFDSDYKSLTMALTLPPSRGSFFTERIDPQTGLFKNFIDSMRNLESADEIPDTISEDCVNLFQSLMDGNVSKSGEKYVYHTHGDDLPITAAASSVREMAPLQLLINKRDIKTVAILIEEPEAHLHPLKQRMIADAIVAMAKYGAMMQITTHSDYFLRRINDLVRLHTIRKKMDSSEYESLCEEMGLNPELTLNSSILAAYFLERENSGYVKILRQNVENGIPFDTLRVVNGKLLTDSAKLYDLSSED